MKEEKKEDDIDIRGIEKSKIAYKSCKVKCIIVAVISVTLLVAAVILIVAVWPSHKVSKCLVEVNLEEGDTLMYRVDQSFEVKGTDSQKETMSSIVGIQVVNKTSDAYWFLLKINTTFKDEEEKVKSAITGYFRVRLSSGKNYTKDTGNETTESFELHGYPQTDGEFVRFLHGLLYQLLPAVRRDLYEDVDGQTDKNVKPENSPLFPGPVRMHRQAYTKQSGDVLVKNQFSQSDLFNSSSDMDLDVKYTDSAAINKSNGMVSESNVYVSELLHFGEPIKTKDGRDVTTMTVTLYSHVTRIEMDGAFFVKEETKALKTYLFVRLAVPTKESSLNDTDGQQLSTQEPTTVIKRNRRAVVLDSTRTATPHPGGGGNGGDGTVGSTAPTQLNINRTVGSIAPTKFNGNATVGSIAPTQFNGNGTVGSIAPTQFNGNGTVGSIAPTKFNGNATVGSIAPTKFNGNGTVGSIAPTQFNGNGTVGSTAPTQLTNTSSNPKLFPPNLMSSSVAIEKAFSLFDSKILGIRTNGKGNAWLKNTAVGNETNKWEMGTELMVSLGSIKIPVYRKEYSNEELEKGIGKGKKKNFRRGIPFCFRVLIVRFCVKFSLSIRFNIKPPRLLTQEMSLSPPKFALQIEAFAEVNTTVEAYASVLFVRAGVFADGTIVRVTVPTKLSYSAVKPANQQWCLASNNAQLTALELHAGLFYQWRKCKFIFRWFKSYIRCWWGTRNTILSFGRWAALKKSFNIYESCF